MPSLIGDALALAAWVQMFWDGMIVDPRPLFGEMDDATLCAILDTLGPNHGCTRLALTERFRRQRKLAADWEWRVVGIGRAEIGFMLRTDIELRSLVVESGRTYARTA